MNTGKPLVNFESYIPKILKEFGNNKMRISSNAKSQLNSFMNCLAACIAEKASFITNSSMTNSSAQIEQQNAKKNHTITLQNITSTCQIVLGPILSNYGTANAKKAINSYIRNKSSGTKLEKISRNKKAKLNVSISKTETILRMYHCGNIAEVAPIYLAATLEYIIAEIVELSLNRARDSGRSTISSRDLFVAIKNDSDLDSLIKRTNWSIVGGGVLQHIHMQLLPKKKK